MATLRTLAPIAALIAALFAALTAGAAAEAAEGAPVFAGHKYTVVYRDGPSLLLDFKSASMMEGTFLAGPSKGQKLSINFKATEVAPRVYMLTWQEADKTTVVHVDDFNKMLSLSNVTLPDGTFLTMTGALTPAD